MTNKHRSRFVFFQCMWCYSRMLSFTSASPYAATSETSLIITGDHSLSFEFETCRFCLYQCSVAWSLCYNLLHCIYTSLLNQTGIHSHVTMPRKKAAMLDEFIPGNWLDSMRSSSPRHPRKNKISSNELAVGDPEDAYFIWMLKYPSALASFDEIMSFGNGKRVVLFLDYDGTLSPIVDDPDLAFMSNPMRDALKNVARRFPTAIISGRSQDKVYDFVQLKELCYAGSHGMDIMIPVSSCTSRTVTNLTTIDKKGSKFCLFQPAHEFLPVMDEIFPSLVGITKNISGVRLENNKFCISVHYRNVDEKSWPKVLKCVKEILKVHPNLCLTHGRKVLEIRPVIDWDKGKAVKFLLESLGFINDREVISLYIGDDRTDEDAFKVLRDENMGHGIIVTTAPKQSNASFSLRDPSEVLEFLKLFVDWNMYENDRI